MCILDEKNKNIFYILCDYCGSPRTPTVSECKSMNDFIGGKSMYGFKFYCSEACKHACPSYRQHEFPKGFKQATSREVQPELRKMVLARDNWTCTKCNKSKSEFPELELHCHHIFPLNEDPIGSADMDTCITVCKECHIEIHKNVPGCRYHELKC